MMHLDLSHIFGWDVFNKAKIKVFFLQTLLCAYRTEVFIVSASKST